MKTSNESGGRVGNFCLLLGYIGLVLFFMVLVPLGLFAANFGAGMRFREAPLSTPEQYREAFYQVLLWILIHRFLYLLIPSAILLWYGIYARRKARTAGNREAIGMRDGIEMQ